MGTGSEIGRVRGLGSAQGGTHHWMVQRLTAVSNLFLGLWLVTSLVLLPRFDHGAVVSWLAQPIVAIPMMLLLVSVFNHIRAGLQVLIEDYVHDEGLKFAALALLNFYVIAAGAIGLFSIARIAFAGGAL